MAPRDFHHGLLVLVLGSGMLALLGCHERPTSFGPLPEVEAAPRSDPGVIVVAHGGQGSPASISDGPARAVELAHAALEGGGEPVQAAILAIESLEDDPRFNAGTGANLRLDGRTIEADAAIMDDSKRFGGVAGLADVRHPIRVAEAVSHSPHTLLVGEGARAFADTLGLERADLSTEGARDQLEFGWRKVLAGELWADFDYRRHWNFPDVKPPRDEDELQVLLGRGVPSTPPEHEATQDTVGIVLRSAEGRYVAALSTGGTLLCLRGRVGDVPQVGAGLYVGPHGAVAATGKGEAISRERVAGEVYDLLAGGIPPEQAIRQAIRGITPDEGVGVIAVSERGHAALATTQMAWAVRDDRGLSTADAARP